MMTDDDRWRQVMTISIGHLVEANVASVVLSRSSIGALTPPKFTVTPTMDGIMCRMVIALANVAFWDI